MPQYKEEYKDLLLEAKYRKIAKIPKNKVRGLSQYIRRLKNYKISKTRKNERYLLYFK